MVMANLRLPRDLVQRNGVKMLIYGGAGTGKTRSVVTAPRPMLFSIEKGLLSIQGENVPVWDMDGKVDEFVKFMEWVEKSNEVRQFDTIYVDSLSELSTLLLDMELPKAKDPRQAYGAMADKVLKWVRTLNSLPNKHIALLAKQEIISSNNINYAQPAFEGKKLFTEITHLMDEIFRFQPKRFKMQQGFQEFMVCSTKNMQDYLARDKSGKLAEDEPQNISEIIAKIMAN